MGMTVPQKKYFIKRIDEVLQAKIMKLQDKKLHQDTKTDVSDFKQALDDGKLVLEDREVIKAALKRHFGHSTYYSFGGSTAIAFETIVKNLDLWFKSREMARDEINAAISLEERAYTEEATRIKDVAMFGNEQEAHEALRVFSELELIIPID